MRSANVGTHMVGMKPYLAAARRAARPTSQRVVLVGLVALAAATPSFAWGPHSHITRAALDVLPERARVKQYLAGDFDRLAKDYVWMADWKQAVRTDHYADDYLLFPGMTTHLSHMLPEVRATYEPYFRRALQALRTESPQNAPP